MTSYQYLLSQLVKYVKKYPEFMAEVMILHQSYDVPKVKKFFKGLDLIEPYANPLEHKNYKKYEKETKELIERPDAYSIEIDVLNQDYMQDKYLKKVYTESTSVYDDTVNTFWPFGRDEAMDWLDPQRGERILEIGIGPGSNFKYYPDHCEMIGIDFSEGMIEAAKNKIKELNKKNITVHLMDAHKTTFPDNHFDRVYSFYALCTVRNPLNIIKEMNRICKPNGKIVMFEPIKSEIEEVALLQYLFQPIGRKMGHIWIENFPAYVIPYNSYFDLFAILKAVGLKVDAKKVFDPPFNIVHLVKCTNEKE